MGGRFGISGKLQVVKIDTLSDGQRTRIVFCWIAQQNPICYFSMNLRIIWIWKLLMLWRKLLIPMRVVWYLFLMISDYWNNVPRKSGYVTTKVSLDGKEIFKVIRIT